MNNLLFFRRFWVMGLLASCAVFGVTTADAQETEMAPLAQYLIPKAEEIALARSAGPKEVGTNATVMFFNGKGYETVATGTNGFTCMVLRSWTNPSTWSIFWNPRVRVPICFNAAAVASILPIQIARTQWVLEGATAAEVDAKTWEGVGNGSFAVPSNDAMAYMLSSGQHLNDQVKSGMPHIMLYRAYATNDLWGGNTPMSGSPFVLEGEGTPLAIVVVPVKSFVDPVYASNR